MIDSEIKKVEPVKRSGRRKPATAIVVEGEDKASDAVVLEAESNSLGNIEETSEVNHEGKKPEPSKRGRRKAVVLIAGGSDDGDLTAVEEVSAKTEIVKAEKYVFYNS